MERFLLEKFMEKILIDLILSVVALSLLILVLSSIIHIYVRVPYVPSSRKVTKELMKLAHFKKGDVVYDLGCGDGRLLFAAENFARKHKTKIQTKGYEAAPFPYLLARFKKWFFQSNIQLNFQNFFQGNFKNADVIFCYLGPEVMAKLLPKFKKECRKGTRIYSNTFQMKGMEPTQVWPRNHQKNLPSLYLYQI